jgi:phospholipid/cholesterol/gamma-HCH transport system substrate-binding protein
MRFLMWVFVGLVASCNKVSSSGPEISVALDDAAGLRGGAPVYVAGVQVGRVTNVRLEGERARVAFQVNPEAKLTLHDDACVAVGHYGLAGEAHLRIEPGTAAAPVLAHRGQIDCVRSSGKLAEDAQRTLDSLHTIISAAASGKGTIGRLLRDEKLADKVERYFDRADAEAEQPKTMSGPAPSAPPTPAPAPKPGHKPDPALERH